MEILLFQRENYISLEVGKVFGAWINERIEQFGFIENQDYVVFSEISKTKVAFIFYLIMNLFCVFLQNILINTSIIKIFNKLIIVWRGYFGNRNISVFISLGVFHSFSFCNSLQRTTRIPRKNRKNKPHTKTIPQRLAQQIRQP